MKNKINPKLPFKKTEIIHFWECMKIRMKYKKNCTNFYFIVKYKNELQDDLVQTVQ